MVEVPLVASEIEDQSVLQTRVLFQESGISFLHRYGPQLPVIERLTTALFGAHSGIPLGIALGVSLSVAIVEFQDRFLPRRIEI